MINEKTNEDNVVIIGNKPEYIECILNGKTDKIKTEPYLRPILKRLIRYQKVFLRVMPYPERLAAVQELFELLKYFAIVEIENRKRIIKPHDKDPLKKIEIIEIVWEVHPKLLTYRDIHILRNIKIVEE